MKRRALLAGGLALGAGAGARVAAAEPLVSEELALTELSLSGDRAFGRALLLVPKQLGPEPELLVLLHGLGESHDQVIGMRAFAERYGLLAAVSRLAQPPVSRLYPKQDYFGAGRLEELNARLRQRPFRCPVLVCPFTPNPYRATTASLLARYGEFVSGPLQREVEARVGAAFPASRCMLSGVSMGGYVALELFTARPAQYRALGLAQGAFGVGQAARYAEKIEAAAGSGTRRVEILTSTQDPYRKPNEALHQQLQRRQQRSRLRVSPGPHDQRWLRESGMIEMLLSADDVFAEGRGAKK